VRASAAIGVATTARADNTRVAWAINFLRTREILQCSGHAIT
jgi:hypothetical protein